MIDFDCYANEYESVLNRGLAISGENQACFAKGRVAWLARSLDALGFTPKVLLDYGCGIGASTQYFFDILGAQSVVGIDVSGKALEFARQNNSDLPAKFALTSDYTPTGSIDLVYCNGVLHHVRENERPNVVAYMAKCLRPGGRIAIYENNPWNPGARLVMSRIPFDRNAEMLSARQVRSLLKNAGFNEIHVNYLFIYPRALSFFRRTERRPARFPFGAQYQVLAYKPALSYSTEAQLV